MPFKPCKSEKKRLNELIGQVKELSDTVDELRAEVNALKICSIGASNECLTKRRNRGEASTLHKFKKCLEKSLIPIFSRDPTCRVRRKCQQIFSQFPTIISPPEDLPGNERPIYQHRPSSSYAEADRRSLTYETSPTRYLDETKAERREKNIAYPSQRRKNFTGESQKAKSIQVSSLSSKNSENSLIEPHESYNPPCTHETCTFFKSSRKIEDSGQLKNKKTKKKTTGTVTSASTSPIRVATPKKQIIYPETVKHERIVSFVDRKKKIPLEKCSSVSCSLSSSNISEHHLQDCSVAFTKPENDFTVKRTTNNVSSKPEKKKCSVNCEHLKKSPSRQKDRCTNTLSNNLSRENRSINIKTVEKVRRKRLASQETQTSFKLNKYREETCFDERRQYCPKAKRSCFSEGSLSSLTSFAPNSTSSFCLGSEELEESLKHSYCKRDPVSEEARFENKGKAEILERETDYVERVKLFPSREAAKKCAKGINTKPQGKRKKRTYLVSSDIPVRKIDEFGQCNFNKEQENSSSIGDSTCRENKSKERKSRKKWKKPEVPPKVCGGHEIWNKQQLPREKHDNYPVTSVCTNRRTKRAFPKQELLSNWTAQKRRQTKRTKLTKLDESTSSSSRACTDETCSLTSDPQLIRSDGSITSDRFDRKEKPTKDFNAFVRQ